MSRPLAVIINTCNRPFLLRDLVNQLKPQLEDNDSIIIVNDGDEGSVDSLRSEQIFVVEHCKPYYALASGRNKGARAATETLNYEWGLFLDDDIEVSDSLIEEHRSSWDDKKTAYAGKITESGKQEDVRKKWWDGEGDFVVKWGGSNMSCNLPSLLEAGGYNDKFDGSWGYEDNELYQRLTSEYGWGVEYLKDAAVSNLKAPTGEHYDRGDTTNRMYIGDNATYKSFDDTDTKNILVGDKELKLAYETRSEKKRIDTLRGEEGFLEHISSSVKNDDVFWDVGACIGIHTIYIAYMVDEVHAFEPAPLNYKRLQKNIDINEMKNIVSHKLALGKGERISHLEAFSGEAGEGRHSLGDSGYETLVKAGDKIDAPVPDVVKVDVEGAEYNVLSGMEEMLTNGKCRAVFVEVHKNGLEKFDSEPSNVNKFLENKGYNVEKIEDMGHRYFIKGEL